LEFEIGVKFQNPIHCFTDYFDVSFHGATRSSILAIFCKNFWLTFEIRFYFVDGLQHISQTGFDVIIHTRVVFVDRLTL
jgi:hypothetical protein